MTAAILALALITTASAAEKPAPAGDKQTETKQTPKTKQTPPPRHGKATSIFLRQSFLPSHSSRHSVWPRSNGLTARCSANAVPRTAVI